MSKTVRVRIAVAVNEHGHWTAEGYFDWPEHYSAKKARGDVSGALYWLEADIPIPEQQTIAARVTTEDAE